MTSLPFLPQAQTELAKIRWSTPDAELWVATADDEYSGMVEFLDGHFEVRNSIGLVIGTAPSVPAARALLENHIHGISPRLRGGRLSVLRRVTPAPYRRASAGAA